MLLIDHDSGLFAYSQPRPPIPAWEDDSYNDNPRPRPGTLFVQLWAPADYISSPFAGGDLDDDSEKAVLMAWVLDDAGGNRELEVGADDFLVSHRATNEVYSLPNGEVEEEDYLATETELGLVLVDRLPGTTPPEIQEGVEKRQRMRLEEIHAVIDEAKEAREDEANLWIRRFDGTEVAGSVDGFAESGSAISLGRARPQNGRDKKGSLNVPFREIAAARKFTGKWKRPPDELTGMLFHGFRKQVPASSVIPPQLWNAMCGICGMAVRLPWVAKSCRSCAEGDVRNPFSVLSDSRLEHLLDARAEWLELKVETKETNGKWRAAYRTPDGSFVKARFLGEPMIAEGGSRREVLIGLNQLSEEHGFNLNPDFEGRVDWEPVPVNGQDQSGT